VAISFDGVLIIAAVAVLVPVVLGFLPALPVPGAVLEVIAGIVVGPSVLGWVHIDQLAGLERLLDRLEDRSAQLRVRATLTLALAFGVLAFRFGFASILGAFAAGLLVRMIDLTRHTPHPQFETKLQGIGFGFLIPIFFIATGVQFDLKALTGNAAAIAEVPLFLAALLVVRGLPALLYVRFVGTRHATVAGLMQATTLTFVIVATQIGLAARLISPTTSASLLTAGLLSAAIFPSVALRLLVPAQDLPEPVQLEDTG
jgi:Kef-type K+ transport system membrane component KefB